MKRSEAKLLLALRGLKKKFDALRVSTAGDVRVDNVLDEFCKFAAKELTKGENKK